MLAFLNDAVRPDDLVYGKPVSVHIHPNDPHPEHHADHGGHRRQRFMPANMAAEIMKLRESRYPLGFRNWRELLDLERFRPGLLDDLIARFSAATRGR